tara:strand:+ start:37 stop:678 length:642 start_codon:yes stop_codon:yes gene_type:complete
MIPKTFIDYYGDETRWFLGKVVDVNDPKKIGRVKVKVFGVYDNIEDKDLPWAQIVVPITQGVHEGKGQYLGILKGTQVFGMFLDGQNSQLPMVIGTVPKEGDENPRAKANYPHNKIYQTERGHYKEYDDTEDNERIKEHHRTGTYYEMQPDGSVLTFITKDNYSIVLGDEDIRVAGKVTVNVGGDVELNSGGTVSVTAPIVDLTGGQNIKLNS